MGVTIRASLHRGKDSLADKVPTLGSHIRCNLHAPPALRTRAAAVIRAARRLVSEDEEGVNGIIVLRVR